MSTAPAAAAETEDALAGSAPKFFTIPNSKPMKKALFLDLDHTLIAPKSGNTFPQDVNDWQFLRNVLSRLGSWIYENKDCPLVIVTNQGGVAAGFQTRDSVEQRLVDVVKAIKNSMSTYDVNVYVYVSYLDNEYRKPLPGLAHKAAAEHAIDLSASLMIGDMASDQAFAKNAGMQFEWAADFFNNKQVAAYVPPLNIREG